MRGWRTAYGHLINLYNLLQIRNMGPREVNRGVFLRENNFKLVARQLNEHIAHEFSGAVRFLEDGGMIGTKRQIVLVVSLLQFRQKFNLLEVRRAVIELERHRPLADLADHIAVACVLLTKILSSLFLDRFAPDRNRNRNKTLRVWAENAPFSLKDIFKRRRYQWNDGTDGRPRSWHVEVEEAELDAELTFLRKELYQRDINIECREITALNRFSNLGREPRLRLGCLRPVTALFQAISRLTSRHKVCFAFGRHR
jgi:hypothetical protein